MWAIADADMVGGDVFHAAVGGTRSGVSGVWSLIDRSPNSPEVTRWGHFLNMAV